MEQNRFFKFIWRTNGLLIFVTALLTLGLILFFTFESLIPTFQATAPPLQTNAAETSVEEDAKFGMRFERRNQFDGNYVTVEAYVEYDGQGLKSYTRRQTRNIGIHNLINGNTNWIFPTNNQDVEDNSKIVKEITNSAGEIERVTVGHFLVTATTSADDNIVRDIWVSALDGSGAEKLIANVSANPQFIIFDTNQARILLETNGALKTIDFDIDTRSIGKSVIIARPK